MHPDRSAPPTARAAVIRTAADLLGVEPLARGLDVKARTVYAWMNGQNPVKDGVINDVLQLLIVHRQRVGDAIGATRAVRDGTIA